MISLIESLLTLRIGTVTVAPVFASRIFLDIQDILKTDLNRGHKTLKSTARKVQGLIESTGVLTDSKSALRWLEKDSHVARKLVEVIHHWFQGPIEFSRLEKTFMKPCEDPNWGRPLSDDSDIGKSNPESGQATPLNGTGQDTGQVPAYNKEHQDNAKRADLRGVKIKDPSFTNLKGTVIKIPAGYEGPLDQKTIETMLRAKAGKSSSW
jgi:hypothetical protein